MKKKVLSMFMALAMVLSLIPAMTIGASATGTETLEYDDYVLASEYGVANVDIGTQYFDSEDSETAIFEVVELNGVRYLHAIEVGSAEVDGQLLSVVKAPLSVFLLIGQSNAGGSTSAAGRLQSIVNEYGTAYYGEKMNGETLTAAGTGVSGLASAITYRWNQVTGDKVWMIQKAVGSTSINKWQGNNDSLTKAITAWETAESKMADPDFQNHYDVKQKMYFWLQGEDDNAMSTADYLAKYSVLHDQLIAAGLTRGELLLVLKSKSDPTYNGPRTAQMLMGNDKTGEYSTIDMVCNLGDMWIENEMVKNYFETKYPEGFFPYQIQSGVLDLPTTVSDVHPGIHYTQVGYNELGIVAAQNAAYNLGLATDPNTTNSLTLYKSGGYRSYVNGQTIQISNATDTFVMPVADPVYRGVEITLPAGVSYENGILKSSESAEVGAEILFSSADNNVTLIADPTNASFAWNSDYSSCTATITKDGSSETKECFIATRVNSHTSDGDSITYSATFTASVDDNGTTYKDIQAGSRTRDFAEYGWDLTGVTALGVGTVVPIESNNPLTVAFSSGGISNGSASSVNLLFAEPLILGQNHQWSITIAANTITGTVLSGLGDKTAIKFRSVASTSDKTNHDVVIFTRPDDISIAAELPQGTFSSQPITIKNTIPDPDGTNMIVAVVGGVEYPFIYKYGGYIYSSTVSENSLSNRDYYFSQIGFTGTNGNFALKVDNLSMSVKENIVAAIGDTEYISLDKALAAAQSGDTIRLLDQISSQPINKLPVGAKIDINGKTLWKADPKEAISDICPDGYHSVADGTVYKLAAHTIGNIAYTMTDSGYAVTYTCKDCGVETAADESVLDSAVITAGDMIHFLGGSLRFIDTPKDENGKESYAWANMRFGYNFTLPVPEGAELVGFGWKAYAKQTEADGGATTGIIDIPGNMSNIKVNEDGSRTANLVFTKIIKDRYEYLYHTRMYVTYTLNGVTYTCTDWDSNDTNVEMPLQATDLFAMRTVQQVADAITKSEKEDKAAKTYAQGLLDALKPAEGGSNV